jgi:hypothetical protein
MVVYSFFASATRLGIRYATNAAAQHPFWTPFAESNTIAVSTPLFVRGVRGIYRDFRLNDLEAVPHAEEYFGPGLYWPSSDPWVNLSDVRATLRLADLLRRPGASSVILDAREVTQEIAEKENLIVVGHPRGARWLVDAMVDLNFRFFPPTIGGWSGIENRNPGPGELPAYRPARGSDLQNVTSTPPEHALLTRRYLQNGKLWLNVAAGRAMSADFLLEKLSNAEFLHRLDDTLGPSWTNAKAIQLLFEVRYVNRNQMTATFIAGRLEDKIVSPKPRTPDK